MSKKKIDKKTLAEIRKLAGKMPTTFDETSVYRMVTGAEILKHNPDAKNIKGKPIDRSRMYTVKVSEQRPVNDERRMKKIYLEKGMPGLKKYLEDVIEINTPKTIGVLTTSMI